MKARLDERLGPVDSEPNSFGPNGEGKNKEDGDWEIHDCMAQWWRPSFETFMVRCFRCWQRCIQTADYLALVSVCSASHYQAKRMQEALSRHSTTNQ